MSKELTPTQTKRFQFLVMKAVDKEITRTEQRELLRFLAACDACPQEYQQLRRLTKITRAIKFMAPPEEVWETYWSNIYYRLESGSAWILFSMSSFRLLEGYV
jgi:hypothetical protein